MSWDWGSSPGDDQGGMLPPWVPKVVTTVVIVGLLIAMIFHIRQGGG